VGGQEDYVFTRNNGQKIKSIKEAFTIACIRAGIEDFRFHDLRHTAASLLAAGGCDIITLQNILGHKTLAMTQRYAHLIPERNERVKEIMQRSGKVTQKVTRSQKTRNTTRKAIDSKRAGVAKLADALDSKSSSLHGECGFDSLLRHQVSSDNDLILSGSYVTV
jgi:hypothetical protein